MVTVVISAAMTSNRLRPFAVLLSLFFGKLFLNFTSTFVQTMLCDCGSADWDIKKVCSLKAIKMVIQQILKQLK